MNGCQSHEARIHSSTAHDYINHFAEGLLNDSIPVPERDLWTGNMVVFEPISVELPMRSQSDGMALQLQNEDDAAQQTMFRGFASDNVRVYHARRPHKKSRKGCLTCKRRRVKVCP